MSEDPVSLAHRFIDAVWNKGDLEAADDILAESFTLYNPVAAKPFSRDAFKKNVTMTRNAFPDFIMHIRELITTPDRAVIRWSGTATNTGPWAGLPPTGKTAQATGIFILHIEDEKITEAWAEENHLSLVRQLGLVSHFG